MFIRIRHRTMKEFDFQSNYTAGCFFRALSDEQLTQLHEASVEILERTGVIVNLRESAEMLEDAGARSSRDGRVRIPASMVDEALRTAPSRVVLCSREGEQSVFLEGHRSYFGCSSDCINYMEPLSDTSRSFVSEDGRIMAVLADYLPNINFINRAGWAADLPAGVRERRQFMQLLSLTSKPIGIGSADPGVLLDTIKMAEIIAGGSERLSKNPFIYHVAEPISPLQLSRESIGRMNICADRGIPIVCYPMPMLGATAPATFAGTLAQGNAEILAGLVLHQHRNPGAPFIYGSISTLMDMRTMTCSYGAPEMSLMTAAMTDLAHRYSLPMYGVACCTDSPSVDGQAAAEASVSALLSLLSGANLIHDVGLADHCTAVGPAMLVLADEIIAMTKRACQPIRVSKDTLALDVIDRVGPAGNYLMDEHTVAHFKEMWYSDLFVRASGEDVHGGNKETLMQRIVNKMNWVLQTHRPKRLSEKIQSELARMEEHWLS